MQDSSRVNECSPHQLRELMGQPNPPMLIHVLPLAHFEKRHLPGAKQACVYEVNFLDQAAELIPGKSTPVVVYGTGGHTREAMAAAKKLLRAGYGNTSILAGGLAAWSGSGFALEGQEADAPDRAETLLELDPARYTVDVAASSIRWTGRNPGTSHFGLIRLAKGQMQVRERELAGEFTVDMASIKNLNLEDDELKPVLEAHLNSDDFFFTSLHPTARLKITRGRPLEPAFRTAPNYFLSGQFELLGVTAGLEFYATLNQGDEGSLLLEAHFDLDRTRWGVVYGSTRFFDHLGMHVVYDLISLEARILARKN